MIRSTHLLLPLLCLPLFHAAQNTIIRDGREFFNGEECQLYAYLNNNYSSLHPIEGIWQFTRIEYDAAGNETSRTPNEFKSAILRDKGNYKRAFIEVNLDKSLCKPYQVVYSIQMAAGNGALFPCIPVGCTSNNTNYQYDETNHIIYREAFSFSLEKATLVGVKVFPFGPPTETLMCSTGAVATDQITERKARVIENAAGWDIYVDWGKQIFPSYLLSTAVLDPTNSRKQSNHIGDPNSTVGILIDNPKNNCAVKIKIEPTKFTRGCEETFQLTRKGVQYAVFPKLLWDYDKLRGLEQSTPLDFKATVTINDKPAGTQVITATLRALDDCPLLSYDYNGDPVDLKFLTAAFVNEGHPQIKRYTTEIIQKKLVKEFVGTQMGEDAIHQQVFAFWKLMRDKGIVYSSIVNNGQNQVASGETYSQRIRLMEDVVTENQANCIDGTAFLASCLAAIDIEPTMVFVPGHAFLGYVVPGNARLGTTTRVFYVETTMIGMKPAMKLSETCSAQVELKSVRNALSKSGVATTAEIDHYVAALCQGATNYDRNIAQYSQSVFEIPVFEIPVFEARKWVKPISRSNALAYSPGVMPSGTENTPRQPPMTPQNTPHVAPVTPSAPTNDPKMPLNDRSGVYTSRPQMLDAGTQTSKDANVQKPINSIAPGYSGSGNTDPVSATLKQKTLYKSLIASENDKRDYYSTSSTSSGTYYKVQLRLESTNDLNKSPYLELSRTGVIVIEEIASNGRFRMMLGEYPTYEEAIPFAKKAQSFGLTNVGIVKYTDGNRVEIKFRDWSQL